jgi:hypothetical protein
MSPILAPSIAITNLSTLDDNVSSITDEIVEDEVNIGGRPKGTTCAAKENYANVVNKATTDAASIFFRKKQAEKNNKYVSKGILKNIIKEIEQERGIPPNTIPINTIRNRVLRHNESAISKPSISPLKDVEKISVEYCIRLAQIGNALTKDQVISLAEDVIQGTPIELASFKKQRKISTIFDNQQRVIVGVGWYKNVMKRNKDKIKQQR